MDVVVEAERRRINLKNMNIKMLFAGENFSENWRNTIHALAGIKKSIGASISISIYGSADADILGHETPLSVYIRRKAAGNKKLADILWGNIGFLPTLVQYHPTEKFFESINEELIFSARSGIPLIRYNVHDRGAIISHVAIKKVLADFGLMREAKRYGLLRWNMPFLTLAGRNDVAVTFYGLNIYPENIKAGLEDAPVAKYLTGKFSTFTKNTNGGKRQKLVIKVELRRFVQPSKKINQKVRTSIFKNFLALNIEYRKLAASIGSRALPTIITMSHGNRLFQVRKAKYQWIEKS
jgi:phenylacetate-CoA ligase